MKIVIINGSPRTDGNTSKMCEAFSKGALEANPGAKIITYSLYNYTYKGCIGCFACKLKNGKSYGKCNLQDNLSPLLKEVSGADCLVIASPIYLMDVTGAMKSFLERLCFPYGSYELGYKSLAPKRMKTVTIYTMNCTPEQAPNFMMDNVDRFIGHIFRAPERLCAYNTYQFNDYSRYVVEVFSEIDKKIYHSEEFPKELDMAYQLGLRINNPNE